VDFAGEHFLEMCRDDRRVLLQDWPILMRAYPSWKLWKESFSPPLSVALWYAQVARHLT
jgi:hypothetical protein